MSDELNKQEETQEEGVTKMSLSDALDLAQGVEKDPEVIEEIEEETVVEAEADEEVEVEAEAEAEVEEEKDFWKKLSWLETTNFLRLFPDHPEFCLYSIPY